LDGWDVGSEDGFDGMAVGFDEGLEGWDDGWDDGWDVGCDVGNIHDVPTGVLASLFHMEIELTQVSMHENLLSCRVKVAKKGKLQRSFTTGPVSWLSWNIMLFILLKREIAEGILPDNLFDDNRRLVKLIESNDILPGMDPLNWLLSRYSTDSLARLPRELMKASLPCRPI
jgi:hypothetical protein